MSFGGPVAHLGYFHDEFVTRRRWLSAQAYADLLALCQFLPGPASSQVGIALGLMRCGYRGAFAAWAGFTLPSALAMMLFAFGISSHSMSFSPEALHGLKIVALAVVAQAVWAMAQSLGRDKWRLVILVLMAVMSWVMPSMLGQISLMLAAGLAGLLMLHPKPSPSYVRLPHQISYKVASICLLVFILLLIGLPLLATQASSPALLQINAFYQSGALVFGGGHVVLPLLHSAVVAPGWISQDMFLAGYSAAQAVPGPLFSIAAFLGTAMNTPAYGWIGGLMCLLAIFAPSFLLVIGALPFWEQLRRHRRTQAAMAGITAALVGLLLATLIHPLGTTAMQQPQDIAWALAAFFALVIWRLPAWLVVITAGLLGWAASLMV